MPGVADEQQQPAIGLQRRADRHRAARLGELHRIGQQMVEHLLQPPFVRPEQRQIVGHVDDERDLGGLRGGIRLARRNAAPYGGQSTRSEARSKRPNSMRATSRMMLISPSRWRPASLICVANSATRARVGLPASCSSASEKPITAFSGVRSSWLIVARKRDLAWFAASAASFARRSSSWRRARLRHVGDVW